MLTGADGRIDALNVEAEPGAVPAASVTLVDGGGGLGLIQALVFAFLGGLIPQSDALRASRCCR